VVEAPLAHEHLSASTAPSLDDLAAERGHSRKHFSRLLRLATLAPDIVGAILDGLQPAHFKRIGLLAAPDVPIA
jgi:site-specific DNA recombinase